jgi:hypothetical protein
MRKSNNNPIWNKCQLKRPLEGLKELENQPFDDYEVYECEEF